MNGGKFIRDDSDRYHDNNIHIAKRLIFITADINDQTAIEFIKNLELLETVSEEPITVYIHTVGGEELAGWAMYDRIRQSPCYVEGVVYGDCSSMGTIILQAFDHRIASENSIFLFHEGTLELSEDHVRNVEAAAKRIPFENNRMYKVYHQATGLTKKQLEKHFAFDRYLTAHQAMKMGFIDEILENDKPEWFKKKLKKMRK